MERIAIGGSAANPPHMGHVALLTKLLKSGMFTKVIWVISGDRDDKQYDVTSDDRVAMTEMTVGPLRLQYEINCQLIIRYNDVYYKNTPTINWIKKIEEEFPDSEVTWYTGSDSIIPIYNGKCEIEEKWYKGPELMENINFLVFPREGFRWSEFTTEYMPKKMAMFATELPNIASSNIRKLISEGKTFEHLLTPSVSQYISHHRLYGCKGEV